MNAWTDKTYHVDPPIAQILPPRLEIQRARKSSISRPELSGWCGRKAESIQLFSPIHEQVKTAEDSQR